MTGGTKLAFDEGRQTEQRLRGQVARIVAKDANALAELYDETSTKLYSFAMRILRDSADAEEVVLDVYKYVWRSPQNFDSQRGTVWNWLCILVRSRAIDRLRSIASRRADQEPSGQLAGDLPGPDLQALERERRDAIVQAVDSLPANEREPIELAYFRGLTHVEIAHELGEPLGTIKTRIRAGLRKLRGLVNPYTRV